MKLIKLSEEHYVVVDDTEIKEGDWCYRDTNIVLQVTQELLDYYSSIKSTSKHKAYKITHSTQPIEFGWGQEGRDFVSKKVYNKVKPLSLSEVKELLGVVDVEEKAREFAMKPINPINPIGKITCLLSQNGYEKGYNQALEDNKEKKYTEDDLRKAIDIAQKESWDEGGYLGKEHEPDEIIQTLQPKTEWDVEFVDGKLKLKK